MSSDILTTITPIYVGLIKYFENPKVKTLYPVNDYLVATLDTSFVCAKVSVCARREFTEDEFWLNGKKCTTQFAFCLNEVKYRAANQRSVSVEFLTRKVHVACENKFLPSTGSSSFSAGFICLMTALCKLYKIKPDSVKNMAPFPDLCKHQWGGFVQKRDLYTAKNNFKGKLISEGKNWPELRVMVLVLKTPKNPIEVKKGVVLSEYYYRRLRQMIPGNFKRAAVAIKERKFQAFADTIISGNELFHTMNVKTCKLHDYKTTISHIVEAIIKKYNTFCDETRIGYTFDSGPNPNLFFLEKHAQEITSFIKFMFPTSYPEFFQGLEVPPYLGNDYFFKFAMEPMKSDLIRYAIYTKVGNVSVKFVTEDHLLDEKGDVVVTSSTPNTWPTTETATASELSDKPVETSAPTEATPS